MQQTYKVIAHLIAAAVVIQAALIAWGTFSVITVLEAGGEVAGPPVPAMLHGTIGMYVIPVLVLALLVVALVARSGVRWALWLVAAVVVQIALALIAFSAPAVGILHGIVAFGILGLAEVGARAVAHAPAHEPALGGFRAAH